MRIFQDAAGRTWTLALSVDAVKRVRDLLREDLLDIQHIFPRLLLDPILLCDVIYCICKPQADAQNISDVDFARAMAGDVIARAKTALLEELVDFFPEASQRELLRLALAKYSELTERTKQLLRVRLESPTLTQEIEAALSAVGGSSTSSPESSVSIPGH